MATNDLAERIAQRTMARRGASYADEVRRLLDAGLEVMRQCGTTSRPRVSDIVRAAGLSNDAFYRHFPSKDALVEAILEDGTERLRGYLEHQMTKEKTPARQVRRWVEGVMSQAVDEDIAATTLAVLWNSGRSPASASNASMNAALATLLHEPLRALGSADAELDASVMTHAIVGALSDYLWHNARPTNAEIDHLVAYCVRAVEA